MKLKPGCAKEYEQRHKLIWPSLKAVLEESGIYDYSIFLDEETNTLFACQKTKANEGSQDLAQRKIVQQWWKYMADIMETHADQSPISIPLKEVFRLD